MKQTYNYILFLIGSLIVSACTTGGFDQNEKLDELNAELSKAPEVVSISVDGTVVERNDISIREVEASVGDAIDIVASLSSGTNAQLEELEFLRQYYGRVFSQEAQMPVEAGSDGLYTISGQEEDFTFTYTVPAQDDDGFDFHEGNIITIQFRVRNSNDYYGYREFVISIIE